MIEIFTDASVKKSTAVTVCFILTNDNYIGYNSVTHEKITTSVLGEILGAIDAIQYASERLNLKSDDVTLYCDSNAMLNLVKCDLNHTTNKQAIMYRQELQLLQSLAKENNIYMELIRGHAIDHNPNKVVDRLCNSYLRYFT